NDVDEASQGYQYAELAWFFKASEVYRFKLVIILGLRLTAAHVVHRDDHFKLNRCTTFTGDVDAVFEIKEIHQ
ncbi:hypothetical protein, partial [Neisseria sp. P0017.S007]|uniref:hypothetical protein n=1 Tax=Neisseria sp. P0017.S007 TaxID=3436783 RepID=UPI003F7E666A